jgi:hypothetical protein
MYADNAAVFHAPLPAGCDALVQAVFFAVEIVYRQCQHSCGCFMHPCLQVMARLLQQCSAQAAAFTQPEAAAVLVACGHTHFNPGPAILARLLPRIINALQPGQAQVGLIRRGALNCSMVQSKRLGLNLIKRSHFSDVTSRACHPGSFAPLHHQCLTARGRHR